MEATVFNSQETPSGLFTLGELETEESSGKVASWEFPTALSLFAKDWVRSVDDRTQVVDRLRHKYEDHDEDMFGTLAGITAIDERKHSERSIT